jgi:hypothetical protein
MRILASKEAHHFVSEFSSSKNGSDESIKEYFKRNVPVKKNVPTTIVLHEGTAIFAEYRDCSLREVERLLFLAASNFRRSHDLMSASSASWAYVTLYYGCFFAAKALIGMFGVWIDSPYFVEIQDGTPNSQILVCQHNKKYPNTNYVGTHRIFWDMFYKSVSPIIPLVPLQLQYALAPISSDITWLTDNRNSVNYDGYKSMQMGKDFANTFSENNFPNCLSGAIATQYKLLETLVEVVFKFATDFGLQTDALDCLSARDVVRNKVRTLICVPLPNTSDNINFNKIT